MNYGPRDERNLLRHKKHYYRYILLPTSDCGKLPCASAMKLHLGWTQIKADQSAICLKIEEVLGKKSLILRELRYV